MLRLLLPICWKIWPVAAKVVFLITVGCSHGGLAQGKSQQGATDTMDNHTLLCCLWASGGLHSTLCPTISHIWLSPGAPRLRWLPCAGGVGLA